MKRLKFKNSRTQFKNDIDRIVDIFGKRGYIVSHIDACRAWEEFSNSMCASWLSLTKMGDDQIFNDVFPFFDEVV